MMVGMMDMSTDMKKAVLNNKQKLRKVLTFTISLVLCLSICGLAFAHSGRLDENGGHWDRSTGTYHYHTGENAGKSQSSSDSYDYYYDEDDEKDSNYNNIIDDLLNQLDEKDNEINKLNNELSDSEDKLEEEQEKSKKKYLAVIVVLTALTVTFLYFFILKSSNAKDYKKQKEEIEERFKKECDETKRLENEISILENEINEQKIIDSNLETATLNSQAFIKSIYEANTVNKIANVPEDIHLYFENDKLQIDDVLYPDYEYGRYTGYISETGKCFHMKKGCTGAIKPICILDKKAIKDKKPCLKCCRFINIPTWAITYQNLVEYAKENNIKYKN